MLARADYHEYLGWLAALVFACGNILYLIAMIRGKFKPSRVSWWIWALVTLLFYLSYSSIGPDAKDTSYLPLATFVVTSLTATASIWYGTGGTSLMDRACFAGAALGIAAWYISQDAFTGLLCFIAADAIGSVPTALKGYHEPMSENIWSWFIWSFGGALNLAAVPNWDVHYSLFPLWIFIGPTGACILLSVRRYQSRRRL